MIPGGRREIEVPSMVVGDEDLEYGDFTLSEEQRRAVDSICDGEENLHYLYGVTGSGKSEVFLRVAQRMIDSGRQAIYLVPEITLTHQLARQVSQRFEGKVAILHSGMTPSQRLSAWRKSGGER